MTHVEREKGKKKKVVLSVNPKKLNKGINRDNVMQGMVRVLRYFSNSYIAYIFLADCCSRGLFCASLVHASLLAVLFC